MPVISLNKNNSVVPKQILGYGNDGGGSSTVSLGGASEQQGTPAILIARYLLTAPQTASVPSKTWGSLSINTDKVQSPSAAVTSQTPFTYTAAEYAFVSVEVRANVTHTTNLGRWTLAFRLTRNGFTSDVAFTFHKAKSSPTVWKLVLNERVWLETGDVLTIEVRTWNNGASADTLTVLDADVSLYRG
jgi:hypothetical protein